MRDVIALVEFEALAGFGVRDAEAREELYIVGQVGGDRGIALVDFKGYGV